MLCLCLFTSRLPINEAVIQISSKTNFHLVVAIINLHFPRHRYVNRHNNVAKHTRNHPFPSSSWAYASQQLASAANTHSSNYHHKAHNIRTNLRFSSLLTFYRVDHWLCVSHTFLRSSKWNYRLSQNESCGFDYQRFHSQSFFIFYFKQVSEPHQLKLKHNLKVLLIVVPVLCRNRRHRQKERKMHLDCG